MSQRDQAPCPMSVMHDQLQMPSNQLKALITDAQSLLELQAEALAAGCRYQRLSLTSLLGLLDILSNTPLTPEQQECVLAMRHACARLKRTAIDMAGMAQLEWSPARLDEVLELPACMDEVLSVLAKQMQSAEAHYYLSDSAEPMERLSWAYDAGVPSMFRTNGTVLKRLLQICLGVACRVTPGQPCRLHVSSEALDSHFQVLRFELTIPALLSQPAHVEAIFSQGRVLEALSMLAGSGDHDMNLAFAQALASRVGGRLIEEVMPDNVTILCLEIPIEPVVPEAVSPLPRQDEDWLEDEVLVVQQQFAGHANLSRIRLLLVEDDAVNRQVLMEQLRKLGFRLDVAVNGLDALRLSRMIDYDLILMDCHMPVMDGYTATTLIREWEAEQGKPPVTIIATTASAKGADYDRCLEVGMQGYLPKPFQRQELKEVLGRYLDILLV
ncbi:MAG: response regulator [Cyanobacteria bacterium HKST-UBA03]|nr:response regulator [Cyanobacteria bacterium HKST-UBA03]